MNIFPSMRYRPFALFNRPVMTKLLHLQGIRGFTICAVIAFHYFPEYCPNGYLGVDIFFVLSGYLMSMMLARHSTLSWPIVAEFLYRRIKRILPLYYLVVVTSLGLVYFCPCSQLIPNMISAARAMFLSTNFNTGDDYFQKLGAAHDFFTHTWSLCLEMQFYLIFPLLWWGQMQFSQSKRVAFLHIISNMVYILDEHSDEPFLEDVKKEKKQRRETFHWIFASLSLVLLVVSIVTKKHLVPDYSRISTSIASITLIFFGRGMFLLENSPVVFLGEVSYSWYLFHWPLLTLQQIFEYTTVIDMAGGVVISFLVSVGAHYSLEKSYLGWKKSLVIKAIAVLFLGCVGLLFFLDRNRLPDCVLAPVLRSDYLTMPLEEKKAYFTGLMEHDQYQLLDKRCDFDLPEELFSSYFNYRGHTWFKAFTELPFQGTCKYQSRKSCSSRTLAIIGNSWVANSSPVVFDECNQHFENIYRTSYTSCEVFYATDDSHCRASEQAYFDVVERLKPDYLFVIQRYFYMQVVHTDEEWRHIVTEANNRLTRLSNFVKEKIFILGTFPIAWLDRNLINNALDNGTPIDYSKTPDSRPFDVPKAQRMLDQIVNSCKRCEKIDYTAQFTTNGSFYPYEPKSFMPYINQGMHFTQPGLERIRPLFTDICQRIGN